LLRLFILTNLLANNIMISIIIVNWNAGIQLFDCVSSIIQYHHNLVSSVIIVDNASTENSLERVERLTNLPFKLYIIRNADNRGFCAACNQGAALANSDFLLFLNPDSRLFERSLLVPVTFIQRPENADIGVVGIQLLDENDCIERSCARFPSLGIFLAHALGINRLPGLRHLNMHMVNWAHNETRLVDHVIGSFFLVRRSLFETLGGFDERFFVYLEDLDFSFRAHQFGWHSVYLTEVQAFHAGGGTSRQVKAHRLFYTLRSRLLYGFKHFKAWQAWVLLCVTLSLELISRLVFTFFHDGALDVRNTLKAYGMLYRDLPNIIRKAHPL